MEPISAPHLTDRERLALASGQARMYRNRVIPIVAGGEPTPEEQAAAEAAAAAEAEAAAAAGKTFSQADVDRIVQERLARAKTTPPADYEELQAKAARLAEIEAENKSELEKATARAEKAEQAATATLERAKATLLKSAIIAAAAGKLADPSDAVALIDRTSFEFDADGNPTNVEDAVNSLLEAKPHLAAAGGERGGNGADQGARGGSGSKQLSSTEGMTPDEIATATAEGRFDTFLATKT